MKINNRQVKIKKLLKLVKGDYAGEIWQFKVGFLFFLMC